MTSGKLGLAGNYLEQIMEGSKLTPAKWKKLGSRPLHIFTEIFPFADDPKFLALGVKYQRFLLAYMLRDMYGFNFGECYRFASHNYTSTNPNVARMALEWKKVPVVKYFIEKLDYYFLEALGYSVANIIEAEIGLAYSDITDYLDDDGCFTGESLKKLPSRVRRCIKSFEVLEHQDKQGNPVKKYRLQLWDKGASLYRMQKMQGLHRDVVDTTSINTQITIDMPAEDASKAYQEMMRN